MSLSATSIFMVMGSGSDTICGGIFDPGQTSGMNSDGAATVANTASPVFTSASYNFVSGDVGARVYIASGTNWIPGWYTIASVASNAATLTAGIGAATLANYGLSTALGCATTASPSSATWSIDYSLQTTAQISYTDLASVGTGLTVSSAAHPFGKQLVGNGLYIASGTNFDVGYYVIASIGAANVATVVGAGNITTGAGVSGVGYMGGALASPGMAGSLMVGIVGSDMMIASGSTSGSGSTFTVTSATSNISGGCVTLPTSTGNSNTTQMLGFGIIPGDSGTAPIIKASSSITTFTLVTTAQNNYIDNIWFDGTTKTGSNGIAGSAGESKVQRCIFKNFVGNALNQIEQVFLCGATTCSGTAFENCSIVDSCVAYANTNIPFVATSGSQFSFCASINNTGAASDGFQHAGGAMMRNCIGYGNGRNGVNFAVSPRATSCIGCYMENNTGYGYTSNGAADSIRLWNCGGYNNTSGNVNTTNYTSQLVNFITLTSSAFTNPSGLDFSLNNNPTGGALLRAAGIPGATTALMLQLLSSMGYTDVGAIPHRSIPVTTMNGGMTG